MHPFRAVVAIAAGVLAAALLFHVGAALAFLVTVGIPLGSSGDVPASSFALNLIASLGAAATGGTITRRIARGAGLWPNVALALGLALAALWLFSRHEGGWPRWYPPVLALVAFTGAMGPRFVGDRSNGSTQ